MHNETRGIDCHTALMRLWDYLDEELTDDRMLEVRRHLEICQHCVSYHDFARRFLIALQATREERVMPVELRARVLQRLAESGFNPR